jgi:hypothetical protein
MKTKQQAMSELLSALGFTKMASDVLTETDAQRLCRYGNVIVKNSPEQHRAQLVRNFRELGVFA